MNYIQSFDVQVQGVTDPASLTSSTPTATAFQTIQYFDGLGRLVQTVQKGITPEGWDMIKPIKYNSVGLDETNYEPYAVSTLPGEYRTDFESAQPAFYSDPLRFNDANGKSPTDFEKSPLNRVLKQGAPGSDWQLDSHPITFSYLANTSTVSKLNATLWKVSGNTCSFNNSYSNNQLYVTKSINEDGAETYEFKDKQGQVVLKRSVIGINNDTLVSTYYVYDDFGLLRFVISPEGSVRLTGSFDASTPLAKKYVYCYTYDARKRLIEKQVPGKEPEYYVYDKTDKVILYQDGNMHESASYDFKPWQFTKYDAMGRIIMTGLTEFDWKQTRQMIQDEADKSTYRCWEFISYNGTAPAPNNNYYSNQSFPILFSEMSKILTLNYYDSYSVWNNASTPPIPISNNTELAFTLPVTNAAYQPELLHVSGKPTVSYTAYNSDSSMLASASYYDIYGRSIQTAGENHLRGFDRVTSLYKGLTGNLQNTVHLHNTYKKINLPGYTYTRSEEYKYTFDHAGRPTGSSYTYNNGTTQQTVGNAYNTLGQLVSKQIAEEGIILQTIDYQYNIRGWLTKINDPANLAATGDLFGMELVYNTMNSNLNNTPAYSGNITGNIWQTAQLSNTASPVTTGIKAYKYTYDKLNRLLAGKFSENWVLTNKYSEYIDVSSFVPGTSPYDLNGNILTMRRYGLRTPNTFSTIDELKYTYDGNKLIAVEDALPIENRDGFINGHQYNLTDPEYLYNANGNLTRDDNKGIINITYNTFNLPVSITNTIGNRLEYTYDASGNKLRQDYYINGTVTKTTDFVGNFVYENNIPAWVINNEGRVVLNSIGTAYSKEVYLKDHLGNIRVACRLESGVLKTRQVDSYYPFGMNIKGLSANSSTGIRPNEYLYNGKMMQDEMGLGWLDYGARFYDAVLGRWHSVDPEAENYYSMSPCNYVGNNPISRIDPDGNDGWDVIKGFAVATADNFTGGLVNLRGSVSYTDPSDFNLGQNIGDASNIVMGADEAATGGTITAGAVVVTVGSGGTAAAVSVPAALGGSLMAAHGTMMSVNGASNLGSQKGRVPENSKSNSTKSDNKLKPSKEATGDHSSFKTDSKGKTTNTATYKQNSKNPSGFDEVKRVDKTGNAHFDKKTAKTVETPHVHENNTVRPAKPEDLPRQK